MSSRASSMLILHIFLIWGKLTSLSFSCFSLKVLSIQSLLSRNPRLLLISPTYLEYLKETVPSNYNYVQIELKKYFFFYNPIKLLIYDHINIRWIQSFYVSATASTPRYCRGASLLATTRSFFPYLSFVCINYSYYENVS